jgi:zinc transport system ATP-binding protein
MIEVKNLSFTYGGANVLEDISFTVRKGDFMGILGPNGSGKSTLIKIILKLLDKQSGSVVIDATPLAKFSAWRKIGYLEQKSAPPSLVPLTGFEVVRLGLLSVKKPPKTFNKEDNEKVNDIMQITNCAAYKDRLFYELSGGQQQRVLLARTLINNPSLLILDEPSTALDNASRESFFDLLLKLNKESATTILLITHDIAEIGKYVNKFLILDKNLIFCGDKRTFCQSDKVTRYFGPYTPHVMDHLHANGDCPLGERKHGSR